MPERATWSKASDFADQRELAARLHAQTAADAQYYITADLRPLKCRSCATAVLVKKNSLEHTSIQWTTDPAASCPELRAGEAAGRVTALQDTCSKLRASIAYAVAEGLLDVGERTGDNDSGDHP